tara:strand:+ start:175 stop:369 length:195 start_codon:yes stop_codon:yes gene_type:complete
MNPYLKALELRYESEIEIIQLNLKNYLDNAVAVAEHPDIVQDIDDLVAALAASQEKLKTVQGMS